MDAKTVITIRPTDVNVDPKQGFTGFMYLPGDLTGDEYRAVERLIRIYQEKGSWAPITERRFLQYVDIPNTLNVLVREGYLVVDGDKIKPTDKLIKETYKASTGSKAHPKELVAAIEQEKLTAFVRNVIDHDPNSEVRFVIFGRAYDRRCRVKENENLNEKLAKFDSWLDHGFVIVNVAIIDRDQPIGPQVPKIVWETPKWRTPKP